MDIVSLGFLFAIVLGGGVSAFLADWLGWRIGKRRLTVLNMRPKHFARAVVTVAGALIPLVTILILSGASEGVRVWITEGRRAVREVAEVSADLGDARDELESVKGETAELRKASDQAKRDLASQKSQLGRQNALLASQETRLSEQTKRISTQVERIGGLTTQAKDLTSRVRRSADAVKRLTAANRAVKQSLTSTRNAFAIGQRSLAALRQETAKAQTDLVKIGQDSNDVKRNSLRLAAENGQLEASIRELTARTDTLNAEIADLSAARDDAQQLTAAARVELAGLRSEVTSLNAQRIQLEAQTKAFAGDFLQIRTAALTFRSGDELARLVVPAGASVADARGLVEGVLRLARLEAERRGARANSMLEAAGLLAITENGRNVSAAEQMDRLAGELAGGKGDTILVARAGLNFFAGEAVALALSASANPVVFRRGDVVAEGRLDSRRDDGSVYAQVTELLGTRVQERARQEKMVPVQSNGTQSFGEVEPGQILDVIRAVRAEERVYRLQAIAAGDIRAGDRLKVELRIR